METIIAATDFSNTSINAVRYAAQLAKLLKIRLLLYHDIETTVLVPQSPMSGIDDSVFEDSAQKLEQLKSEISRFIEEAVPVDAKLCFGSMLTELSKVCHEEQPLLTVMAASTKEKFERHLTGSYTLALSHKTYVPVLLVPAAATFTGVAKIAVATDLADVYETLPLQNLTGLLKLFSSDLDIVNIVTPQGFAANALTESIALQTHFSNFNPQFIYIESEDVEKGINEYIAQNKPDLLVVIPKLHGWFYKSKSKSLVLFPAMPVIMLPQH